MLAAVIGLETLAAAGIGIAVIVAALGGRVVVSGVAAGVTVLIAAALLGLVAVGTYNARPWSRSAAIVWQLVQGLVGLYAFQGAGAAVGFGLAAVVPAVLALVLLFSRPVREATARRY